MFRVKICGVTNALDVQMVADAGADAMGLNFYAQSKRYVTIEQAIELAEDWPDGVARVGVFVNASTETIRETADLVRGSRFHLIRGAGHLPCVENPQEYARVLTDFLREIGHV